MSSILKVDQIQLSNGNTPTAGDLGLNDTGTVLQVITGEKSGYVNTTSSSYTDVGLSATITPTSTSSKILVFVNLIGGNTSASAENHVQILRDSTVVKICDRWAFNAGGHTNIHGAVTLEDSPASTSALVYKVQYRTQSGTFRVNDFYNNNNRSNITLMEISG